MRTKASDIEKHFAEGKSLTLTFTLFNERSLDILEKVLSIFLQVNGMEGAFSYMSYCLRELTGNAERANVKRLYFKKKGLNINREADYKKGMERFKREAISNFAAMEAEYTSSLLSENLNVKVSFSVSAGELCFEITNGSAMTYDEYKRIHDRITRSCMYSSFESVLEQSEGAGLGLIIVMLMLKKFGGNDESLTVETDENSTVFRMKLKRSGAGNLEVITSEAAACIENLPPLSESVSSILSELSREEIDLGALARRIKEDVQLSLEVLRLVNSAAFSLRSPCSRVEEAVRFLGTEGVRNMIYALGAIEAINKADKKKRDLWYKSYKTAFYARSLARIFYISERDTIEDAYIAGLLHDIGRIVFEVMQSDFYSALRAVSKKKQLSEKLLLTLALGAGKAEIGACVLEKWRFPPKIVEAVRYHSSPAKAENTEAAKLCHLVSLSFFLDKADSLSPPPRELLEFFSITNEEKFKEIAEEIVSDFTKIGK